MSHIAELMKSELFEAGATPLGGVKSLKKRLILGAAVVVAMVGVGAWTLHAASGPAPVAMIAPVPVTVETVQNRDVRIWSEFSGRMTAVNAADIRPEVGGRVTEVRFSNGQSVRAGDILFVIDPRPYEAAVAKAQADLATATNNAQLAKIQFGRAQMLMDAQAVARDFYDQRANAKGVAVAAIQAARAELTQARLDVDRAYVKAPISGRVGRAEITVGNLVQAGPNAPLLTSIVSDDGIYADFEVDEQTYLRSIHDHASTSGQEQRVAVELTVQGDSRIYDGTIESFDNRIDTGTGTIRARARFANADRRLVPGMFATVRLAGASNSRVLLVPEDAVSNDQSKRFVYVVGRGNKALFREVALGQSVNGERVVLSGLKSGERIVIDGLQRVQPGAVVAARLAGAGEPAAIR